MTESQRPVLGRAKTFQAEPTASRQARYFVCDWLSAHDRRELSDRVGLAVSELAANAVLHTTQPFTVTLDWHDESVRLELIDSVPDRMAVPVPTSGTAVDLTSLSETGRGLQIVGCLANRWGVTVDANVKRVWADFGPVAPGDPAEPEVVDHRPPEVPGTAKRRLQFLQMPVRAAIASGFELEDSTRDIHWIPVAERDEETLTLLALIDQSAPVRLAGRHAALHAASQNRLEFDLELDVTDEALLALGLLNDALARRAGAAQRPPGSDEVRAYRRWLIDETMRQRNGYDPRPFGSAQSSDRFDWLFGRSGTGYLAVSTDGKIVSVNEALARALGRSAAALERRPFTELLSRSSQAAFGSFCEAVGHDGVSGDLAVELESTTGPVAAVARGARDGDITRITLELPQQNAEQLIHALQQTLIPAAPPSVPGLDVAAVYHPAQGEVGGDFYDVFEVADNDWCVVLGDVSGKGVDAAIVTAAARHSVRSSALREPVPSGLMHALNRALVEQNSSRFCTVVLARLQLSSDSCVVTFTTGGHPFPLLIRHGTATKMGRPGSLLGVFDDVSFYDMSIRLEVGDALVLFTDGVIEARNAEGELFGDERLHEAVVAAPPSADGIASAVLEKVLAHQSGGTPDDIALVVIRR